MRKVVDCDDEVVTKMMKYETDKVGVAGVAGVGVEVDSSGDGVDERSWHP